MHNIYKKMIIVVPCLAILQCIKTCDPGQEPDGLGGCVVCPPGTYNSRHNPVDTALALCTEWTKCNEEGQYILTKGSAHEDNHCWCNNTAGYGPKKPQACYTGKVETSSELEEACQCRKCRQPGDCPVLRDKNGVLLEELTLDVGYGTIGLNSCQPCSGVPVSQVVPPTPKPVKKVTVLPSNSSDVSGDDDEKVAASSPKEDTTDIGVIVGSIIGGIAAVALLLFTVIFLVQSRRGRQYCNVAICGKIHNQHQYDAVSRSSSGYSQRGQNGVITSSDSAHPSTQPGAQNGVTTIQPGAQNRVTAIQPGSQNGVTAIQPGSQNGVTAIQPGAQNGVSAIQPCVQPSSQPSSQPNSQPSSQNGMNGHHRNRSNGLDDEVQIRIPLVEVPQGRERPMDERHYTYDVFLAHSSEDEEEILQVAECLEENHHIKCCYAYRDFQLGKPVMNNVADLFAECRHVALFLTENYLKSGWCQHEQSMALNKAVQNGGWGMIPVLFKDFPDSRVPPTLRAYSYCRLTADPQTMAELARHIKG